MRSLIAFSVFVGVAVAFPRLVADSTEPQQQVQGANGFHQANWEKPPFIPEEYAHVRRSELEVASPNDGDCLECCPSHPSCHKKDPCPPKCPPHCSKCPPHCCKPWGHQWSQTGPVAPGPVGLGQADLGGVPRFAAGPQANEPTIGTIKNDYNLEFTNDDISFDISDIILSNTTIKKREDESVIEHIVDFIDNSIASLDRDNITFNNIEVALEQSNSTFCNNGSLAKRLVNDADLASIFDFVDNTLTSSEDKLNIVGTASALVPPTPATSPSPSVLSSAAAPVFINDTINNGTNRPSYGKRDFAGLTALLVKEIGATVNNFNNDSISLLNVTDIYNGKSNSTRSNTALKTEKRDEAILQHDTINSKQHLASSPSASASASALSSSSSPINKRFADPLMPKARKRPSRAFNAYAKHGGKIVPHIPGAVRFILGG